MAALAACREVGTRAGALHAGRGRHWQDAPGRGVPARGTRGRLRLPHRAGARLRHRHRTGRHPHPRARAPRPRPSRATSRRPTRRPKARWPRIWWRPMTPSFSTTCSTCRSRSSCAPSTTPWTTQRAIRASSGRWPRLVERASRARPRLLVVEDVHWADRLTLAHLASLDVRRRTVPGAPGHDLAHRGRPARPGVAEPDRRRSAGDDRPRPARARRGAVAGERVRRYGGQVRPRVASSARPATRSSSSSSCATPRRSRRRACPARCRASSQARWTGSTRRTRRLCRRPPCSASASSRDARGPPARPARLRPRAARDAISSSGRRARLSCSPTP